MCVTFCERFVPNEGGVAGYVDRIWCKDLAKWGIQMVGMNSVTLWDGALRDGSVRFLTTLWDCLEVLAP